MQIPILNGVYADDHGDFRSSYPRNMVVVPKQQGISNGYLRPAPGVVVGPSAAPGESRGAINWNGKLYRVQGPFLVRVEEDGSVTEIGRVSGTGFARMSYSFTHLAVQSGGALWLYDGNELKFVEDPDIGTVRDQAWIDGYFVVTDGATMAVTELNNPFAVNPLKYGSSEVDPDPILAVLPVRQELTAVNRYTVESFTNVGGDFFPFQRVEGAQITRGAVGQAACAVLDDALVFLGGGRNEPVAVWIGINGGSSKLSTREVDTDLQRNYTEAQLASAVIEVRQDKSNAQVIIRLPDKAWVYDAAASKEMGEAVWYTWDSGLFGSPLPGLRAANMVWCYGAWQVGDPLTGALGSLSDDVGEHWGSRTGWEFGTIILYNDGAGAIFHQLELVALTGRVALNVDALIWTQYSLDGETWSQEDVVFAGRQGERSKRIVWLQQGTMEDRRMQRFRGDSTSRLSFARLEAQLEPLAW